MADDVVIRVRVRDQTADGFRDVNGRLRDLSGRFAAEGDRAGRGFSRGINGSLSKSLRSVGDDLGKAATGMVRIGAGAGAVALAGGALQQLAGAALVIPGAISVAAAAVETFKLVVGGISEALSATSSGTAAAGSNMAAFGRQVRDANRAIEDAQRGVDDANRALQDSYRGVADAERQVTSAKRDVRRATDDYREALADEQAALARIDGARQEAIRTLADLAEAQDDSIRSVEGAELALKRANANLVKTNKDVKSTQLDRQEAAFAVKEAEDRLSDAQRDATDSATKYNTAQAKGIEGSDQVVAAQEAAASAHKRTEAAAEGVVSANEALDSAYRGVEDAQRGVEDAQRGVEDAHRAVADAVQRLDDVYAEQRESAAKAAGGADAYADALSKISPEAREVVKVLRGLSDEWRAVQFAVQDAGLDGVAEDISKLAGTYLPLLKTGLTGIAGEFNDMEGFAFDALMDPDVVAAVNTVLSNTAGFLDNAETALGDFLAGFAQLAGIGSNFLPQMGTWISDIAKDFRDWVEQNPDEVTTFIQDAFDGFGDLFDIIGNVINIVGALFDGLADGSDDGGETFLEMISRMSGDLLDFVQSDPVQNFLTFIGKVASALVELAPYWVPVAAGIWITSAAMGVLNAVMDANVISLVIIGVAALVAAFIYLWNNVEGFRNFWIGVWDFITTAFGNTVGGIGDYFTGLWNTIQTVAGWISGVLTSMWGGLAGAATNAVNAAITPLNGLIDGLNWVIDGLNNVNPFEAIPHVPHVAYLARGGIASGLAVVGENGPELVDLPAGSRVRTAGDSARDMARQGDQGGRTGTLELRVAPGSDSALASLLMRMVRTGELQLVAV